MTRADDLEEKYRRHGDHEWKRRGSALEHHLYSEPVNSRSRRRCHCGCKRRASHRGMANGICLAMGCELSVARWVRSGHP